MWSYFDKTKLGAYSLRVKRIRGLNQAVIELRITSESDNRHLWNSFREKLQREIDTNKRFEKYPEAFFT